jgi:hypothetical protein
MTVPPLEASRGLDLEYRPRHYQLKPQEAARSPCRAGLPPCLPGEAEIARLAVGSVDADCYSLRARRAGGRFQYRIVDQYFTTWLIQPRSTQRCLSLGELLRLIDGARPLGWESSPQPLADLWRNRIALTRGAEAAAAAITVTSASYPGVEGYYQRQAERWLATTRPGSPAEYAA